jgi:hypothetical protein
VAAESLQVAHCCSIGLGSRWLQLPPDRHFRASGAWITHDRSSTQPVQPGRPAKAAGYLRSRSGWAGYKARRAQAGYLGWLLTPLCNTNHEFRRDQSIRGGWRSASLRRLSNRPGSSSYSSPQAETLRCNSLTRSLIEKCRPDTRLPG